LRVFLGTIPDYAADIEGVKLNGVRKGGPADKAGLEAGDVIISFAGQSIKNIYDYTYALDAATIGKVTTVTIRRMNQVLKLRIKPSPRP
jgi:S1-C subfamily serine protease